ncbi:hypothetical protein M427DRAFT_58325 [Gonapodya prolifera JEL478]|uniref:Uncharacterized protein n=1 Tax=Gonapodya prolifera (strain JEL478) TaxID=1344416 RepID=A0A139AAG1_GONPJ|nr:hypothetical protein M427DRAFT_58325 [Gonapodya prolifera JEL478]|eukprot:KXS13730.1 hypothetical protein M427DRAFT_58325 [Gonapodya prolifera JEL478]
MNCRRPHSRIVRLQVPFFSGNRFLDHCAAALLSLDVSTGLTYMYRLAVNPPEHRMEDTSPPPRIVVLNGVACVVFSLLLVVYSATLLPLTVRSRRFLPSQCPDYLRRENGNGKTDVQNNDASGRRNRNTSTESGGRLHRFANRVQLFFGIPITDDPLYDIGALSPLAHGFISLCDLAFRKELWTRERFRLVHHLATVYGCVEMLREPDVLTCFVWEVPGFLHVLGSTIWFLRGDDPGDRLALSIQTLYVVFSAVACICTLLNDALNPSTSPRAPAYLTLQHAITTVPFVGIVVSVNNWAMDCGYYTPNALYCPPPLVPELGLVANVWLYEFVVTGTMCLVVQRGMRRMLTKN